MAVELLRLQKVGTRKRPFDRRPVRAIVFCFSGYSAVASVASVVSLYRTNEYVY